MLTFYDARAKNRRAKTELSGGVLVSPYECPERVDIILERLKEVRLGDIEAIKSHGLAPIEAIHDKAYINFLEHAWEDWEKTGYQGEALPINWPGRRLRDDFVPRHIEGKLGYYALAGETSIDAGTWDAARASTDMALTALAHVIKQHESAFALCRPPGHHAASDQFGGYCFFNNAAIAAQAARDQGIKRVAILDVDYHHGNGTQQIFYSRSDVLFTSLHCDPMDEFPYYLGLADERGEGEGEGFNCNHPMAPGTGYDGWLKELEKALDGVAQYDPGLLIVSLGVDTFAGDPIGTFKLTSDHFLDYGKRIAQLGLPTLFLMEGGYAVAEIGVNAVNVLTGFESI